MPTLRIEHPVPDFGAWKKAFDSDPAGRQRSGVRRYRILRPADGPNYVMIDLEFETVPEAKALLATMRTVWAGAGGRVSSSQQARIAETAEVKEY